MSSDSLALIVDGSKFENFTSYRVESDLYTADDAFRFEFSRPEPGISPGQQVELRINDELVLTGIIDRVSRGFNKNGLTFWAEGRDLMGLLVDSCCEEFVTVKDKTLKEIAETLLADVPFINREAVVYQDDLANQPAVAQATEEEPHKYAQIQPGSTIFDTLKTYAMSRGYMFWCEPDGTFVFGRPEAKGEAVFSIFCTKEGTRNNAVEGEAVDDISGRYSQVTVIGQRQGRDEDGDDETGAAKLMTSHILTDADFPFYKPYVTTDNNDELSPEDHARMIMEKQKKDGFRLSYRVPGHTQKGKLWAANELCRVVDEVAGLDDVYLIYSRTFELSRQGKFTNLQLGYPGITA
jgi:prophage tail gpP-like protein